ncbi:NACHT domain-containing protein [Actinomadura alba]|uniref:SUMF1/EgtB/PvdO family nonheme iron enzyme n=1 Tax=Actinomadura alba TaxID=406431 RepID=A0ABR7LP27_9ACTN|nr:SUMF1/EgtB/PvdO family nonheme iron enzyme [Actinomadura alba]MBC6466607.1 SUMF1/EgtB/PvdO family nonheme iron enzyme [Actinomadura alba]
MTDHRIDLDEREERPQLTRSAALSDYLAGVIEDTEHLVFGNPRGIGQAARLRLKDVWIPQDVTVRDAGTARAEASPAQRRVLDQDEPIQIDAALNMRIFRKAVITGNPGYGKSTLCARLAHKHAVEANQQGRGWIPLHVPLRMVNQRGVWSSLEDLLHRLPQIHDQAQRTAILDANVHGYLWIFLDGLDEVSTEALSELRRRMEVGPLASANRVTLTCRTADYWNARPLRRLDGTPVLELSGFSEDELDLYVENWHVHAGAGRTAQIRQRISRTRRLLDAHGDLRELAESPLLAAVVCIVESQPREARMGRAALLRRAIDHLLAFPEWRRGGGRDLEQEQHVDRDILRRIASRLAFRMLTEEGALAISRSDVRGFIAGQLVEQNVVDGSDEEDLDEAKRAYFDRLVGRSSAGLMQERETGWYEFAHRSFQEYLAAQYLIWFAERPHRLRLAGRTEWREVFGYAASIVQVSGQGAGDLLILVHRLLKDADPGLRPPDDAEAAREVAERACLAAEMLAEFGVDAARQWGLADALSGTLEPDTDDPAFAGLWPYAVRTVLRLAERQDLPRLVRMRALCAVSRIDDPRLSTEPAGVVARLMEIPGGRGQVGTSRPLDMREIKKTPSSPPLEVTVRPFRMAGFPVTNREYAEFVDAGGYDEPRWWSGSEASRWQAKDPSLHQELVELWESQKELNFVKEFSEAEFAAYNADKSTRIARRTMDRDLPLYWHDSRFNLPTAPVVGVNLWEAEAYCRWLQDRLRSLDLIGPDEEVGLPTEIEWEWAAGRRWSGTARAYPWGDEFDDTQCLVRDFTEAEPRIIHFGAVPVGFTRIGLAPDGPEDLAGNVWEWVSSLNYPWTDPRDREARGGLDKRVVRGGSWYSRERLASHVSFRVEDPPCNAYWDLGFRIVVRRRL